MEVCSKCDSKLKNGVISSIKELFVCGLVFVLLCAAWVAEKFDKTGLSAFDDYCDDYWYGGDQSGD